MEALLKNIEKKPFQYIGAPSLKRLFLYFQGFQLGSASAGKKVNLPMPGFQKWIENHYKITDSGANWVEIVSLYSTDYREWFTVFFPLYRQFCNTLQDNQRLQQVTDIDTPKEFKLYQAFSAVQEILNEQTNSQRIEDFSAIVDGLLFARKHFGLTPSEQEQHYHEFQTWIWQDRQLKNLFPWERIYSFFDKTVKLEAFFDDYDRFLTEKGYPSSLG
ncbi:MAG: hypothetical protein HOM11_07100 [Methylococcales bacterium]|jgi:hypothetical protein|nr:hypothetical protein [Methylococcales bacterium]MBT7446040.1 hypothetical protein [Methylococcales bacterium]